MAFKNRIIIGLLLGTLCLSAVNANSKVKGVLFKQLTQNQQSEVKSTFTLKENKLIIKSRLASLDMKVLSIHGDTKKIVLELFEGKKLLVSLEKIEHIGSGEYNWIGKVDDIKHSQVIFSIKNNVLTGKIAMPSGVYDIHNIQGDVYRIEELNQSAFPKELEPIEAPQVTALELNQEISSTATEGCDNITVMVAYSTEAKNAEGGKAQIEARINLAISETNKSYENSGLTQRIRLVHTMETSEADNDFSNDLYALKNLGDGIFNTIDAEREAYGADLVALIIEDTKYCGLGYVNSSASSAFSVTARTCTTGYFSFGHELGHNMGARHDWYVDDSDNYSHGYVNVNEGWRTIMAYNTLCRDNSKNCTRLQYWSNPNIQYSGNVMGIDSKGPSNCIKGSSTPNSTTCKADNRLRLNSTCAYVANFRSDPKTFNFSPIYFLLQ